MLIRTGKIGSARLGKASQGVIECLPAQAVLWAVALHSAHQ